MSPDIRIDSLLGRTVLDDAGEKVGKIGQVYLDNENGAPTWVTVKTRGKQAFVPIGLLGHTDEAATVPFSADVLKDSPEVEVAKDLNRGREEVLYRYYGVTREQADQKASEAGHRYVRPGADDGDALR
ncbi:PRC-barrel domain-containing protein [Tersicoccus sp. MR15.9]|uniref:PRC-barrel domain-containing protein n=1 Tax=Tersicoccus mangrovi TaxID=3121635 RepID=UPI002FE5BE9E